MSFDRVVHNNYKPKRRSQSLWNRAMSFDYMSATSGAGKSVSQSLWNRAMSFDVEYQGVIKERLSQSLWNRAMSFDCSGVLEPCVARLPRATSQLFLMFE